MESSSVQISSYEAILLIVGSRFIASYYYLPELHTPPANQDVWIGILASVIYFFICFPISVFRWQI